MDENPKHNVPDSENSKQQTEQEKPVQVASPPGKQSRKKPKLGESSDVLIPRPKENPVVSELKRLGLYQEKLAEGKHKINCPWAHEHTEKSDVETLYFEPVDSFPLGSFCCDYPHEDHYDIQELLESINVSEIEASHKPVIMVKDGKLHRVVDAMEYVLAESGQYYQSGGLIVSVAVDPKTDDPYIQIMTYQVLTKEMSSLAIFMKMDGRKKGWVVCDPPQRHLNILIEAKSFCYLPVLKGLARQPYFLVMGELVTQPGYNETSGILAVFDQNDFQIPEPTMEAAREALALLEELVAEFRFVADTDKAAALSAIFTAVVRTTLALAPANHVRAPMPGSGKSFLCELIGLFASPAGNKKISFPTTSEEASKVILALLITNPAVIEFDDMDSDWKPHGIINRMLTAEEITERILGVSKTATASTRSLILGSGNNVGPVRDLMRRVLTINIDPQCATPALLTYKDDPVKKVRENRGRYVSAVLTIILAWRNAGLPRTDVESIATYSGAWSDYCRHPLIWLGLPDPAQSLIDQVKYDPDSEALKALLISWYRVFGSERTTVRKVVSYVFDGAYEGLERDDLKQALYELPILDKGYINNSKFGWFLKKNANRIIDGYKFEKCQADGRFAWRVVYDESQDPSPPAKSDELDEYRFPLIERNRDDALPPESDDSEY